MTDAELANARELATHAADIRHLKQDMDRLVEDMDAVRKALADIQTTLAEAKGGWKILMMLGGAGGVLGAALTQFVHNAVFPGGR